jgi:hypothetical protein
MDNTSDVLRKAAEILGERGWCQRSSMDDQGHLCALGALGVASRAISPSAYTKAGAALARHLCIESRYDIPEWNDVQGRTAEDVILAMKRAAENE